MHVMLGLNYMCKNLACTEYNFILPGLGVHFCTSRLGGTFCTPMQVKEYIFVFPGKTVHSKQEYEIYSQNYMWLGLFCFKHLKCGRFASVHAVLVGPYSDRVVCKSV